MLAIGEFFPNSFPRYRNPDFCDGRSAGGGIAYSSSWINDLTFDFLNLSSSFYFHQINIIKCLSEGHQQLVAALQRAISTFTHFHPFLHKNPIPFCAKNPALFCAKKIFHSAPKCPKSKYHLH